MSRILTLLIMFFICSNTIGQDYKKYQSKLKHTEKIISIATSEALFATSSYDKTVIVWDYNGKVIYKCKLTDGKINSLSFIPNSNSLLIGITETNGDEIERHVIKCLDSLGRTEYELIDTILTQESADVLYDKNTTGVRNAIGTADAIFPQLSIKKDLQVPQVNRGISHIELVQSIAVSPDNSTIASIDKFNILKIWDRNHKIQSVFKIANNKKDTRVYFRSDSTIFIEPNITLNIRDTTATIIQGFEKYSSVLFKNVIYFYFNYNIGSRPEKLYNLETLNSKEFDLKNYYTITCAQSKDKLALLGVDGLIRVINSEGELLSTFGKDMNELITFRGEKIQLFSKIRNIGMSPNGQYIISGDENGKVIIWKY